MSGSLTEPRWCHVHGYADCGCVCACTPPVPVESLLDADDFAVLAMEDDDA